jgi:hypothetical protein
MSSDVPVLAKVDSDDIKINIEEKLRRGLTPLSRMRRNTELMALGLGN